MVEIEVARPPKPRRASRPGRRVALALGVVGVVLAAAACAGAVYQAVSTSRDLDGIVPAGDLVDVEGRRLHLVCLGEGEPTVVLEASGLGTAASWRVIQPALAPLTRTCAYDRAGMGWSDPADSPRTAGQLVAELHGLLHGAGVPEPYVMVGHSMGGFVSRLYASRHRDEVAGLVLVDSGHEDLIDAMPRSFERTVRRLALARVASRIGLLRLTDPLDLASNPSVTRADFALLYRPRVWDAVHGLIGELDVTAEQMREAGPLRRDLPAVVLTHTPGRFEDVLGPGLDPREADTSERRWQELQSELASLTPRTRHIVARDSGHMITEDEPDLVVGAIAELVSLIRRGKSGTFVI